MFALENTSGMRGIFERDSAKPYFQSQAHKHTQTLTRRCGLEAALVVVVARLAGTSLQSYAQIADFGR